MTSGFHLAQLNVALPVEPLTEPRLAGFVELLDPVNTLADASPGFVWRLTDDDGDEDGDGEEAVGNATSIRLLGDDRLIVNLTVWESLEALSDFVYGGFHVEVMRRRREWFAWMREAHTCCWWIPRGDLPTLGDAQSRLALLDERGPTPASFTLQRRFAPPDQAGSRLADDHRFCPA